MPPRPNEIALAEAADALGRVAPLVARWIERLLAAGDPPLTPAQHQALHAVAEGGATSADLARGAGVSPAAVSQLLAGLEAAGLAPARPWRRRPAQAGPRADRRGRTRSRRGRRRAAGADRDPARRPAAPRGRRAGAIALAPPGDPLGHPSAPAAAATARTAPSAAPAALRAWRRTKVVRMPSENRAIRMDAADADALEASALTRTPKREGSLVGRGRQSRQACDRLLRQALKRLGRPRPARPPRGPSCARKPTRTSVPSPAGARVKSSASRLMMIRPRPRWAVIGGATAGRPGLGARDALVDDADVGAVGRDRQLHLDEPAGGGAVLDRVGRGPRSRPAGRGRRSRPATPPDPGRTRWRSARRRRPRGRPGPGGRSGRRGGSSRSHRRARALSHRRASYRRYTTDHRHRSPP